MKYNSETKGKTVITAPGQRALYATLRSLFILVIIKNHYKVLSKGEI